jgi:hypothetical protein
LKIMSLIAFPKRVQYLPLLSLIALFLLVVAGFWGLHEKIDSVSQKSSSEATDKSQNLPPSFGFENKEEMKISLPPVAAPQLQARKNVVEKSLKPANGRSWSREHYRPGDDPSRISEELQETLKKNGVDKTSNLQMLGERATRISTDLALELLNQLSSRPDQQAFLKGVLSQLLAFSPQDAAAWTEQYLTNDMKEAAFGLIGELYAMQNPAEAASWASDIENPALRIKTYESIAFVWGASDLNSAYDWAVLLEDYGEQSLVFLKLGEALAIDNPQAAADWALTFEDQALGTKILAKSLNKWSLGGLPEAAQWAAGLPDGMYKTYAVTQISSVWGQINSPASFEWAESLPTGETRDLALSTITDIWSRKNPAMAADSALAIEEDSLRLDTLRRVLTNWSDKEPLSPARWAETIRDSELRREVEKLLQP